jgi:hypothetical protein
MTGTRRLATAFIVSVASALAVTGAASAIAAAPSGPVLPTVQAVSGHHSAIAPFPRRFTDKALRAHRAPYESVTFEGGSTRTVGSEMPADRHGWRVLAFDCYRGRFTAHLGHGGDVVSAQCTGHVRGLATWPHNEDKGPYTFHVSKRQPHRWGAAIYHAKR